MKVVLAEHAGACYGVQRALDQAMAVATQDGSAQTLGPLIHNPIVVKRLGELGVNEASGLDEITSKTVIIRSHGVTPDTFKALENMGVDIVDATCPHVKRAQNAAAELAEQGYIVLVVGEKGHPEVEGLTAYAHAKGGEVHVVSSVEDIPACENEPIGIVVQTTQRRETLNKIVEALEERGISPKVKNTICSATTHRQNAAADLAINVDVMVVVGGRNSSNTTRLAEICTSHCPRTHHIESPDELQAAWFEGCDVVGVTAGASTPEDQIAEVVERLEQL